VKRCSRFFLDGDHGMALKLGNDDHLAMIHGAYAWKKKNIPGFSDMTCQQQRT